MPQSPNVWPKSSLPRSMPTIDARSKMPPRPNPVLSTTRPRSLPNLSSLPCSRPLTAENRSSMLLKTFDTPRADELRHDVDVGLRHRLHDGRVDGVVDLVHRAVHRLERVVARRRRRAAGEQRSGQRPRPRATATAAPIECTFICRLPSRPCRTGTGRSASPGRPPTASWRASRRRRASSCRRRRRARCRPRPAGPTSGSTRSCPS